MKIVILQRLESSKLPTMTEADIKIPYAIANFAELRERGYYYIDKTEYIRKLERYKAPVFLRPRRFGKSLFVSTLAHYYDRNKADKFETLFGGTSIGDNPTVEHNKYIVIRYDFSKMSMSKDKGELENNFNLLNSGPARVAVAQNRDIFGDFIFHSDGNASQMLSEITDYVSSHNLPPLYILIDEYDNFTNQLLVEYNDEMYEDLTTGDSFLSTFFKVIKSGIGDGTIRSCFCTGVLPVTMDDLTSGFNIAEILTLKPEFSEMLGFTHAEAAAYLRFVIDTYNPSANFDELWTLVLNNYDGYHFLSKSEPLINSTILTYFLKRYAINKTIPDEMVDENLRTDVSWIRRLTLSLENAKEMLNTLLIDGEMLYSQTDFKSKFNKKKFFSPEFYPISLFYLGMTTQKDAYTMVLPNLTARSIYQDYYNELNEISSKAQLFVPAYRTFAGNREFEPLFYNYVDKYLGQFPAQAFDKINENFVRCSFFEVLSRYLSDSYTFALEQNLPSGRADLVLTGIPGSSFHNDCRIVEFKYFKASDAAKVEAIDAPRKEDVNQVNGYAADINAMFPNYEIKTYVAYLAANKAAKIFPANS